MEQRERLRLERGWKFTQTQQSVLPQTRTHSDLYSYAKAGGARGPASASFQARDWQTVTIPHDWQLLSPFDAAQSYAQGYKARGKAWYRVQFQLQKQDASKQICLEFGGIATHAHIYCNGTLVKQSNCGYTAFSADITDFAYFGAKINTVAVFVDAEEWEGWWYEGAGIYRDVFLVKKNALHIAYHGVYVNPQPQENGTWCANLEVTLENSFAIPQKGFLTCEIFRESEERYAAAPLEISCTAHGKTVVTQKLEVPAPQLWDVETPVLYTSRCTLQQENAQDTEDTVFGFRTIAFLADSGFFLNGKSIKLKGTCNHQDHAGVGVAVPFAVEEYRIRRLKEMGCNAYRPAHGNPSESILNLCDQYGMLVMDENRNFNSSPLGMEQVRDMVLRDRNHPCVVLYSVCNEEPLRTAPQGRRIAQSIASAIRALDSTRPLLTAMNGGFMAADGCATALDITGFNYFLDSLDEFHAKYPNQPVLCSETNSAFATRGTDKTNLQACEFGNFDEEYAPWGASVRKTWQIIQNNDYLAGMFVWTGFDYRGEPSPCEWPSISSHFGIMDTCGFPKDTYYLYQAYWTNTPVLHLVPHWNFDGREGERIRVMTYSNCEEIELFLNGASLGKQKNILAVQCEWHVPYQAGTLCAKGYVCGTQAATDSLQTAAAPAKLVLSCTYGNGTLDADEISAAVIDVCAVDAAGNFVPFANNVVTFEAEGGAEILGVGNGDPNCHEADVAAERSLFHGRCQLVVKSNGRFADTRITARAEGLKTATLSLTATAPKQAVLFAETTSVAVLGGWRMSHTATAEMPDVTAPLLACDMNTMEEVSFDGKAQALLDGKVGFYAAYRTTLTPEILEGAKALFFCRVTGMAWISLNGRVVLTQDCTDSCAFEVLLPQAAKAPVELAVVLQCNNKELPFAGIEEPVLVKY